MHAIDSWLETQGRSREWLAGELDSTRATLSRTIAGKQWPGREFFIRLAAITEGKVTANDFLPLVSADTPATTAAPDGGHAVGGCR